MDELDLKLRVIGIVEADNFKGYTNAMTTPHPEGVLSNPSQAQIVGPNRNIGSQAEVAAGFLASMEQKRDAIGAMPGEVQQTPEQVEQIQKLHAAVIELGDDLGIDLRSRLPKIEHYHFFDTQQDYTA